MDRSLETPTRSSKSGILLFLFFLSGTSSLVYEIVWQRMMMLTFGASAPATASILTSFFLGIALGSWLAGRWIGRFKNTLRAYSAVELGIGLAALAVPFLLSAADGLYRHVFMALDTGPGFSFGYRFLMSVLTVLPATFGMGATVPVMNRLLHEHGRGIGGSVATAYGINTLGAVTGCLLTGLVLIRYFGMQSSIFLALALNASVVLIAFMKSRKEGSPSPAADVRTAGPTAPSIRGRGALLISVYFVSGFLALAYEVTWLRILAIFNTNSIITFSIAVAVYLAGFSTGSLLLYHRLAKHWSGMTLFFLSNFGAGVAALALIPVFYFFPDLTEGLIGPSDSGYASGMLRLITAEALTSLLMMFIPAMFLGLAYPALCRSLIEHSKRVAADSGFYYLVGNLGSMMGVFWTGLFIIPALGLVGTLGALIASSIFLGSILLMVHSDIPRKWVWQTASAVLIVLALHYAWTGTPFAREGHLVRAFGTWISYHAGISSKILRYRSGASATVMVKETRQGLSAPRHRRIYIDDQPVAATDPNALVDSKMLAHIPLLLHPDPRRALTVGFGSGGTSWSMVTHGIQVDAVEIEPEVIRSASFFADQNFDVLNSPSFHLILNDARNYLYLTEQLYDVISTDVTNLQYKQNGNLYTREYFELLKKRLRPGGIACVWIPIIGNEDQKILFRTFQTVFPHASLWYMDHIGTTFFIMIGTPGPLKIDFNRLRDGMALPAVARDLRDVGIEDPLLFPFFLYLDEEAIRQYVDSAALHTDDHPILEFFSPAGYYYEDKVATVFLRLHQLAVLQPKDVRPYVAGLRKLEETKLARYSDFSKYLAKANRYLYFFEPRSREEELRIQEADRAARNALRIFPGNDLAQSAVAVVENERRAYRRIYGIPLGSGS